MKIIKGRYDLVFFFFFPFTLITTFLYFFSFDQFINIAAINWLAIAALFILIFLPKASRPLGEKITSLDFKWLGLLFAAQLILNTFLWSFAKIIYPNFDIVTFIISFGFFPWGFMICLALTLGYFTYHKKKLGLLSSTYVPLFKNTYIDSIGVTVDSYMRSVTFCNIIILLVMLALSLILLIEPLALGLNYKIVLITTILFLITSHRLWIKFLHYLMHKNISTLTILLGFAFLLSLLYLFLSKMSNELITLNLLWDKTFLVTNSNLIDRYFQIVVTFWGLALSMTTAGYIAYISQAKSMRQIIIYAFFLNVLSWLLIINFPVMPLLAMIICCILMIVMMLSKQNFTYFLRATLPGDTPIKPRSSFRFLKIAPIATVAFLCGFLGMNLGFWSFLAVFCFLPPAIIILISFVSFGKELLTD